MTTIKIGWRNLWRNTRRTVITAGAVGLGLASMILALDWSNGVNKHLIDTVTLSGMGDAQAHAEGYRETRDAELVISNAGEILKSIESSPGVISATPRAYGNGLAAMGDRSANVEAIGVDPVREPAVTNWTERFIKGRWPASDKEAAIGRDLAETLELSAGSKIVFTLADVKTGDMNSALVTISGIFFTNNPMLDKHSVIMPLTAVQKGLGLRGGVHEIAMRLDVASDDKAGADKILTGIRLPGINVSGWRQLVPVVSTMEDMQFFYMSITLAIIFFIISFGILNTMTMALFERFKEFGVLRAMGTSPGRLAGLIVAEAASLGAVGSAIGLILALGVHAILVKTGINVGSLEAAGVTFETTIRPIMHPLGVGLTTLAFLVLTPLTAVYPAVRAARIRPVDALRVE